MLNKYFCMHIKTRTCILTRLLKYIWWEHLLKMKQHEAASQIIIWHWFSYGTRQKRSWILKSEVCSSSEDLVNHQKHTNTDNKASLIGKGYYRQILLIIKLWTVKWKQCDIKWLSKLHQGLGSSVTLSGCWSHNRGSPLICGSQHS